MTNKRNKQTASKTCILEGLEFTPQFHTLWHADVIYKANMQNRSGCFEILELTLEMPLDVAQIFSESLHKYF